MTIQLQPQPDTFFDGLLRLIGKERAYILPVDAERTFGPYVYAVTVKESFWSALFRRSNSPLPEGLVSKAQMEALRDEPKQEP